MLLILPKKTWVAKHLDCTGCAACFDSSLHVQFGCRPFNHNYSFKCTHRYGHMNSLLFIMTLFIPGMTEQTGVIRIMVLNTWSFVFISNSKAQMSVFSSPTQQMLMNPLVFWEIKDRCCFCTSWPKAGPARDERCSSFHCSFLLFHSSALWKHFNYAVSIENASINL